jgi:phenylpropionate dioxygenase-like ring-hydroxylating dioxygenase large terminal subunit
MGSALKYELKQQRATDQIRSLLESHRVGWTLQQHFYRDPAIFELDLKRIFGRYWLFSGHVSQVRHPGDYIIYQIGIDQVIIVRDHDEEIRAFFNTCRHRGSLICTEPTGRLKSFVCPYHQWSYALDGSLKAGKHLPDDFDKSEFNLHKAHCRVMEGLIFISLSDQPPDFSPVELDAVPHLKPHGLERAKICQTRRYDVRANWKLIDENARECYHCPGSHKQYCHAVMSAAAVNSPALALRHSSVLAEKAARWKEIGLETEPKPFRPGTYHSVSRFVFRPGVVTESLDGQPVAPLMGRLTEPDSGVLGLGIYPNLLFEASSDHAVTLRFTPVGPELTRVEMNWLVHEGAVEGRDYEVKRVEAVWRATAEQDWKLCEDNQTGVNSSRYQPGPYVKVEWGCEHFIEWYLNELRGTWEPNS